MNSNSWIVLLEILFFIVPLALVGAGAAVYDWLQRRKTCMGGNYRCGRCGLVFPMKGASISGYESHRYGLHIHCSQCGAVVEQFVN
ncbi:MAG: hypothetical protein ACFCUE_00970 [Candidatus Bathyarchaeia archaeon]|jgi:DNA-directed RNA polymerase subunit RPC12/RpoP